MSQKRKKKKRAHFNNKINYEYENKKIDDKNPIYK